MHEQQLRLRAAALRTGGRGIPLLGIGIGRIAAAGIGVGRVALLGIPLLGVAVILLRVGVGGLLLPRGALVGEYIRPAGRLHGLGAARRFGVGRVGARVRRAARRAYRLGEIFFEIILVVVGFRQFFQLIQ